VAFVVAITNRNKRYGAATTRLGRVNNRILGLYTGSEEGPSNRELTGEAIVSFASEDDRTLGDVVQAPALDVDQAATYVRDAYDEACTETISQTRVDDAILDELLALTGDDDLQSVLEAQQPHSEAFIDDALAADES
jgi:CRISPR-associated protein Csc2